MMGRSQTDIYWRFCQITLWFNNLISQCLIGQTKPMPGIMCPAMNVKKKIDLRLR